MPTRPAAPSLMAALGFPAAVDRSYQRVLGQSGREVPWVASSLFRTPEELLDELAPLLERGIVRVEGSRLFVAAPGEAVAIVLRAQSEAASQAHDRLEEIAAAIPFLAAGSAGPGPGEVHDVEPLDGEVSSGGQVVGLLRALILQSQGDLLWLRPDQWRNPREDLMASVLGEALASGRRSKAIYPVRALTEARDTLEARARLGEQIRVLPELPTRMLVVGTSHAILPEPLGFADEPRSLVRQRGLVQALVLLFDHLWDRAAPVHDLEHGIAQPDLRRFLLQQMATGAQDEQIARRLGISLRTVRRRVADILTELGADTRFQAAVEAVRRGWL